MLSLTAEELNGVERAYTGLLNKTASRKRRKNGEVQVTVGPAGTAKILFALRPDALMPWDDPIRNKFGWDGSAASYRKHLEMARGWLKDLAKVCEERLSTSRAALKAGQAPVESSENDRRVSMGDDNKQMCCAGQGDSRVLGQLVMTHQNKILSHFRKALSARLATPRPLRWFPFA